LKCKYANISDQIPGTKSDLKVGTNTNGVVTEKQGRQLKKKIKAQAFVECSAKTSENIITVFHEAVKAITKEKNKGRYWGCL